MAHPLPNSPDEVFKRLQSALLKRPGVLERVDTRPVLHHDEQAVLTAVEMALDAGRP